MCAQQLTSITERQREQLCLLLMDAVHGGASVGFIAPLSEQRAQAYWDSVFPLLATGHILLVAEEHGEIVGSVQVAPCAKENGSHRAEVQKLFVLERCRGKGIATRLMRAAEDAARALGRSLLVLDTHQGSAAEGMYAHMGWKRAGVIPDYAGRPDGTLHGTVLFYKRLK